MLPPEIGKTVMYNNWYRRTPPRLLKPYLYAHDLLWQLVAIAAAREAIGRRASELNWLEDAARDMHRREIKPYLRSLAKALVTFRDTTRKDDPLIEVEEEFGAVAADIVEFRNTFGASLHRAVISFAMGHLTDIIDDLGFDDAYPDAELYAERCEDFDEDEVLGYLSAIEPSELAEFDWGIGMMQHFRIEVRLEQELFRVWTRSRPAAEVQTDTPVVRLSVQEQKIIEVLEASGHRLTTDEIIRELMLRYGNVSTGTTKMALAKMTGHGLLTNRQDVSPNGYGLPDWGLTS